MDTSRSHRLIHIINNCVVPDNTIQIVTLLFLHFDLSFIKFLINTREQLSYPYHITYPSKYNSTIVGIYPITYIRSVFTNRLHATQILTPPTYSLCWFPIINVSYLDFYRNILHIFRNKSHYSAYIHICMYVYIYHI